MKNNLLIIEQLKMKNNKIMTSISDYHININGDSRRDICRYRTIYRRCKSLLLTMPNDESEFVVTVTFLEWLLASQFTRAQGIFDMDCLRASWRVCDVMWVITRRVKHGWLAIFKALSAWLWSMFDVGNSRLSAKGDQGARSRIVLRLLVVVYAEFDKDQPFWGQWFVRDRLLVARC